MTLPTANALYGQALAQIYLGLEATLHEQLVRAFLAEAAGTWSSRQAAALLAQVEAQLAAVGAHLDSREPAYLEHWFRAGQAQADEALAAISAETGQRFPLGESSVWHRLNTEALEALARDLAHQRGLYLGVIPGYPGSILRQMDDLLRRIGAGALSRSIGTALGSRETGARIRDTAISALRRGAVLQDLAAEIDRGCSVVYFKRNADGSLKLFNGKPQAHSFHSPHFYGQMASRTGISRALEEGSDQRLHQADIELYQVSSHGSLCYLCRPFEGRVFRYPWATSARALRYPLWDRDVPLHPCCQHRKDPYVIEAFGPAEWAEGDRGLLEMSNTDLYSYMRDTQPGGSALMAASRQGFALESQWNEWQRMGKAQGIPDASLRGPRWRYEGIEGRRQKATARMLEDPKLTYGQAMDSQTRAFMQSADYVGQRPEITPARQLELVKEMR